MSIQIKTPAEIADEIAREADARGGTGFMGGPIYTPNEYRAEIARRAIEADRAQRPTIPADMIDGARELLKEYDADELLVNSPYEAAEWLAESLREILNHAEGRA